MCDECEGGGGALVALSVIVIVVCLVFLFFFFSFFSQGTFTSLALLLLVFLPPSIYAGIGSWLIGFRILFRCASFSASLFLFRLTRLFIKMKLNFHTHTCLHCSQE